MRLLNGTKTMLAPMIPSDFEYMLDLYRKQGNGTLYNMEKGFDEVGIARNFMAMYDSGEFKGWVIFAVHPTRKETQKAGIVFINDLPDHQCLVNGVFDKTYIKGLGKRLKRDKVTVTEEAYKMVVDYCLKDLKKDRIEAQIDSTNKLAIRLSKKVGFESEGVLKNKMKKPDGSFIHFNIMSVTP